MYKGRITNPAISQIQSAETNLGDTIEAKVRRFMNNKEPLEEGTQELIYTAREDGIMAAYDPRADRWEAAVEAMDKVAQSQMNRRNSRQQQRGEEQYDTMSDAEQRKFDKKFPENKHAKARAEAAKGNNTQGT